MEEFEEQGYCVFKKIFAPETIAAIREECLRILPKQHAPYSTQYIQSIFNNPAIRDLVLGNKKVIDAIKSVMGDDFVLIDETSLHDSAFGGAHTDTTSLEAAGLDLHKQPNFLMSQWAVYPQSNSKFGGGLSLAPASHKLPDPFVEQHRHNVEKNTQNCKPVRFVTLRSILRKYRPLVAAVRSARRLAGDLTRTLGDRQSSLGSNLTSFIEVKSEAGDLVCFNLKTWHMATPWKIQPTSDENRKLAIFFVCGANNEPTRRYRQWIDTYHDEKRLGTHRVGDDLKAFLTENKINFM